MKVEQLSLADYNKIKNIPVVNQDLSANGFTPVANTYYRHTGTTDTYTQGVIYCYDGTEYKALDGAGGISDVKVNGTSVVTNGVANISGTVTTGAQTFNGTKTFVPNSTYSTFGFKIQYVHDYRSAILSPSGTGNTRLGIDTNPIAHIHARYVQCSYIRKDNYTSDIDIPKYSGTMMVAPTTWSSGTSGSVTLTESGTYQVYAVDKEIHIDFGAIYVDLTTEARKSTRVDMSLSYVLSIGSSGSITINQIDTQTLTEETKTIPIYYRRIGI